MEHFIYYNENKLNHAKILECPRKSKIVSNLKCPYICFLILLPKLESRLQSNLKLTYVQASALMFLT